MIAHRALAGAAHHHHSSPHHGSQSPWWLRLIERLNHSTRHLSQLRPGQLLSSLVHYLELGVLALAVLLTIIAATRGLRVVLRHRAAIRSVRLRILLPEQIEREGLDGFFRTLSSLLRPRLGVPASVTFTITSAGNRFAAELSCGGVFAPQVVGALKAAIHGVGIEPLPPMGNDAEAPRRWACCSLRSTGSRWLPLQAQHRVDPAAQVLAALQSHEPGETAAVQLSFSPLPRRARTRARKEAWMLRTGRRSGFGALLAAVVRGVANDLLDIGTPGPVVPGTTTTRTSAPVRQPDQRDLEQANAIGQKTSEPALALTLRLQTGAARRRWARERLSGLSASFAQFRALGGLRPGREFALARRFQLRMPSPRPPLIVTASEAAALLPLPEQAAEAPLALPEAPARSVAPVADAPGDGVLLGLAEDGWSNRELWIEPDALLQHVHVLGPTGRGKTTELCNLYLEAARLDLGAAYIEPKGDAIGEILKRIPAKRTDDVVLLDFGDELHPPALNLLACAPGEEDLHANALVAIFARLFGRFWGPRSEDILRSALATLLTNRDPQLPMPTLADVLSLLTDPAEKARRPVSDPVALAHFWRQWRASSDSQREQALAPLANKLRAFLGRRALRNVLCQEGAPDFERIVAEGKLLLVALPERTLGDAADLVGSVIVHRLWQTAQRLGPDPARPPFLCLVDEAHRFCRLPQGLAQALAEARGYRLGFVLAHQHLGQLTDPDLAEAVHANTQTKLCFALPPQDAHRMEAHFLPRLDEDDLRRLGRYRLACRVSHDGRQLPAATAIAFPLSVVTEANPAARITAAAHARALTVAEVEAAIRARYGRPDPGDGGGSAAPDAGPPSGPPSTPPPEGGPHLRPGGHDDAESGGSEKSDKDELIHDEDEPRAAA